MKVLSPFAVGERMDDMIRFSVRGLPVQQGSARAFVIPGKGGAKARAIITHDTRRDLGGWRHAIASAAQATSPSPLWDGPVGVEVVFVLPQPKYRSGWVGRGKARHRVQVYPDRIPDLDKLCRAALDSLTNVIFTDDSRVVDLCAQKRYGDPGAQFTVYRIGSPEGYTTVPRGA
jgi:crossover junction endodeoxyribonuclease RusA